MLNTRTRILLFAFLRDAAGAAPALGSNRPKNRLQPWSRPKNGGSGSATLLYSVHFDSSVSFLLRSPTPWS